MSVVFLQCLLLLLRLTINTHSQIQNLLVHLQMHIAEEFWSAYATLRERGSRPLRTSWDCQKKPKGGGFYISASAVTATFVAPFSSPHEPSEATGSSTRSTNPRHGVAMVVPAVLHLCNTPRTVSTSLCR